MPFNLLTKQNLVAAGTNILTNHGEKEVKNSIGKVLFGWNGMNYNRIFITEITEFDKPEQNHMIKVTFERGYELTVNKDFIFNLNGNETIKASELEPGIKLKGWVLPDNKIGINVVVSVEDAGEFDKVYAIEEPLMHSLILNGIAVPDERGRA